MRGAKDVFPSMTLRCFGVGSMILQLPEAYLLPHVFSTSLLEAKVGHEEEG